jgi:hypothetical protein
MSRRATVLIAAFLTIPSLLLAQRGAGGGGSGRQRADPRADWNALNGASSGLQLSNRDVEDMSPLKLLIDKRKDLKLTDDELKGLKDAEQKLKTTNEPAFKALDSLRSAMRPRNSSPSDEDRARMSSARRGVPDVVATIRANYTSAFKDALALLNDSQREDAKNLVEKQSHDADATLAEKLNPRRPGEGGARE